MSDFRLNSPQGKAILARVRGGDHAHPGEEEAIAFAARHAAGLPAGRTAPDPRLLVPRRRRAAARLGARDRAAAPTRLDTIGENLAVAGWRLDRVEDWSVRFIGWYESLLGRLADRRMEIIRDAGTDWYEYVVTWYSALHRALTEGRLGGAVLIASAVAAG